MKEEALVASETSQVNAITVWVIIWLFLCTSVVYKYKTFIHIFWSFATCTVSALLLHGLSALYHGTPPPYMIAKIIRCFVGVILLGLGLFSAQEHLPLSFCIAAGYLVFDLWYYCCGGSLGGKSGYAIAEDVTTLTLFLMLLTQPLTHSFPMRLALLVWTLYKTVGSLAAFRPQSTTPCHNQPQEEKPARPPANVWNIHGQAYDLTKFQHPGGREALWLAANRPDATALFTSYHPALASRRRAQERLAQYALSPDTRKDDDDAFYNLLRQRVETTLWEQHRFHLQNDRAANSARIFYYILVSASVLAAAVAHARGSVCGSLGLAVAGWLWGALGHDAGHFTVSRTHPVLNDVSVWAMGLLCNPMLWQHQHTYAHHSFTNDIAHDPDLHHFHTFLRVHEAFRYYNIYQYQKHPLYVFFAYTFVVFGTCIWIPWGIIQDGSLYGIVQWTDRHRPWRTLGLYLHLLCYTLFILVLPFFVHVHWSTAVLAVTGHVSVSGVIFAIFSQINHLNESSMPPPSSNGTVRYVQRQASDQGGDTVRLASSWAVQQIESSNNFCPQSVLWYYLSNGLNLQIEHHLFPNVNHCHLHKIQPIVQRICAEYGVQYKCYSSWHEVMQATLQWLQKLSSDDDQKTN